MCDSTTNQTSGIATYASKMGQFVQRVNTHIRALKQLDIDETETLAGLKSPEVVLDYDKRMTAPEELADVFNSMPLYTTKDVADRVIQHTTEKGFSGIKARQYKLGDDSYSDDDND